MTGHAGTTAWEVLLVCSSAPICLACYRSAVASIRPKSKGEQVGLEALLVWFPMVLCQTKYLYPYGVGVLAILTVLAKLTYSFGFSRGTVSSSSPHHNETARDANKGTPSKSAKLDYLTAYRSSILYLTFIAILAVDFHVFPRRFCKTEVAGFGLMDVGAASFCLSAGLVSPRARRKKSTSSLWKSFVHTLPLVVIGLIRIIANRELEYQEHVSEYGVHWNFFFTMGILALVPPLLSFQNTPPTWWTPTIIMVAYQFALTFGGLQDFVETAPRTCSSHFDWPGLEASCNVFAANREGILGCLGYLSLFFLGEWVGYQHLWNDNVSGKERSHQSRLWKTTAVLWINLVLLHWGLDIPVSRRSTNLSFCVWAAAHNLLLLATLQSWSFASLKDTRGRAQTHSALPIVWDTVNRYGLLMFLIANLLTGLVNITVPTLQINDALALFIVFGYICAIGKAALLLDLLWTTWKGKDKMV